MLTLYYYPLCPISRLSRVLLKEQNIDIILEKVDFLTNNKKIEALDPIGELPIIKTNENTIVAGIYPLIEYIISLSPNFLLSDLPILQAAEMRKMIYWLNVRFNKEVTQYIINEKLINIIKRNGAPRTEYLRAARINLSHHVNYFIDQMAKNGNLSTEGLSVSDIFLACHISVIDYFGEFNWDKFPQLKTWYALIKSRPSFRQILTERVSIISPPDYYENPDF